MKRFVRLGLLLCVYAISTMQSCHAIVWCTAVGKGEIPGMVQTPALRETLKMIQPLGGTSTEGSWNHCTLYYRSTQDRLQEILDKLSALEKVDLIVVIDPSGKVGRVEPQKHRPLPGTLIYQFSVSVSRLPIMPRDGREKVSVVIHKSAGIDPVKLRMPNNVRVITASIKSDAKAAR